MKLSLKRANKSHRVMVFGSPKSGKTQLVGKLSSEFNLIYVDMENGSDTLLKLPEINQERIEVISLPDTRSYPIAIETCLKLIKGTKGRICEAHGKWNCPICTKNNETFIDVELNSLGLDTIVVFDSITQLTNSAIAFITKNQPEDYKMEWPDWANLGKLMDTFLSHVQQAPFNVACISHESEVKMEDGKDKLVPTAGTSNFSRNTAKYFDEVVYCEVRNKKHVAASSTTYSNSILTGSRHGIVLENSEEPSLIPIFKGDYQPSQLQSTSIPSVKAQQDLKLLVAGLKKT
jgi:hypothetical protein